jgi:hypothetical protein
MGNELVKFDEQAIAKVDDLINSVEVVHGIKSEIKKCITIVDIRKGLEKFFTDEVMKQYVLPLMNTSSGFRTDRDPKNIDKKTNKPFEPYPVEVVKSCIIDGFLDGVGLCGNQMNIIASRHYVTKEGFGAKLDKIPDLAYKIIPQVPKMASGGALVDMAITWQKSAGKEFKETLPICVKLADGQGADVANGKALRKARAWLFTKVTGREIADGEADDDAKTINIKAEDVTGKANDLFKGDK